MLGKQVEPWSEVVGGRYELTRRLARGGVGEVFAANDRSTGRPVALKRLLASSLSQRRQVVHFMREYHALSELKHPSIIEVYDYGVASDAPYYTMELLDGSDLRDLSPLPYRAACSYLRDVASSLALLHARRLIHRDVSARNIRRINDSHCKLLDFGAMTAFGVPRDVTGTPPFVPPEALQGASLDQRSDLYALGAVAYLVLTDTHAYRASEFGQLPEVWRSPLPRPSKRTPDIPRELDDLVMALLHLDPAKRPSSAAEVIHRLSAIGQLEVRGEDDAARSFFVSTRLCGRDRQRAEIAEALTSTLRSKGKAVLIEGEAGSGKTRMLNEVAINAQTAGLCVVRATAQRQHASGGMLARDLVWRLQQTAPTETDQAGARDLVWPDDEASERASTQDEQVAREGRERRVQLLQSITQLVTTVARQRPLLIAVDDFENADEFSVALVAGLARCVSSSSLMVAVVQTDQSARDDVFRGAAKEMRLEELTRVESNDLIASMFGAVPNLERVSDWLFRGAHGNPKLTVKLVEHLMNRGLVRYVGGTWVMPTDISSEPIPADVIATYALQALAWSDAARQLADLLCLRRGGTTAELCLAITNAEPAVALGALNELVRAGVLETAGDEYVFSQDAMRDALEHSIDHVRVQALHRQWAERLLASDQSSLAVQLEAGWHLVHTADALRGAELLASVSPELASRGAAMAMAIPALQKALEVYERCGKPLAIRLRLRSTLALASYLFDYRLATRYGETTLTQLHEVSGVARAGRLSPWLGPRFALRVSLLVNEICRWFAPRTQRGPSTLIALQYFVRSALGLMGVHATALDSIRAGRVFDKLSPLAASAFGAVRAAYFAGRAFRLQTLGRESDLDVALKQALHALGEKPHRWMSELEYQDLRVGLLTADGVNECYRVSSQALVRANQLASSGTQIGMAAAARIRMLFHMRQGDFEEAERQRSALELHAIQAGTTWQVDWFAIPVEGLNAALWSDLVALRRTLERLDGLAVDVESLQPLRNGLRIAYELLGGDVSEACRLSEEFVKAYVPRTLIGWGPIYSVVIAAMLEAGRPGRGLEIAEYAMSFVSDDDRAYVVMYAPLEGAYGMALQACGEHERGKAVVDACLERLRRQGEHVLIVTLLQHQVRLAHVTGNTRTLTDVLATMCEVATQSRITHAILLAERVRDQWGRSRSPVPGADVSPVARDAAASASSTVTAVQAASKMRPSRVHKYRDAVHWVARLTHADEVFLFGWTKAGVRLLASRANGEPSAELVASVEQAVEDAGVPAHRELLLSETGGSPGSHTYSVALWVDDTNSDRRGALVVRGSSDALRAASPKVFEELSRWLREG